MATIKVYNNRIKMSENEINVAYECRECGERHDTKFKARFCCGHGWKCIACGQWYEKKEEAQECCPVYRCTKCEKMYNTRTHAELCCN